MSGELIREMLVIGGVLIAVAVVSYGVTLLKGRRSGAHPMDDFVLPENADEIDTNEFPNGGARPVGGSPINPATQAEVQEAPAEPVFETELSAYEEEPEHQVKDDAPGFFDEMEANEAALSRPRPVAEPVEYPTEEVVAEQEEELVFEFSTSDEPVHEVPETTVVTSDANEGLDVVDDQASTRVVGSEDQHEVVSFDLDPTFHELPDTQPDVETEKAEQDTPAVESVFEAPLAAEVSELPDSKTSVPDMEAMKNDPILGDYDFSMIRDASTVNLDQFQDYLVINVVSDASWDGRDMLNNFIRQGLRFGHQDLFHRAPQGELLFSVANSSDTGTFDLDTICREHFHGVSCFIGLPGGERVGEAFEAMLETASKLAEELGGKVVDENMVPLTAERVGELHQRILDSSEQTGDIPA